MRRLALASLCILGCARPRPVRAPIVDKGFSLLSETGPAPLREEAGRLKAWAAGREGLSLSGGSLKDSKGGSFRLGEPLLLALSRMNDYFAMTGPVSHAELKAALLSKAGAAEVRRVYEGMISQGIAIDGKPLIPEAGGDAALSPGLALHEFQDFGRPLAREIARHAQDPVQLAEACAEDPEGMSLVDEDGLLSRALTSWPAWEAKDKPPRAEREAILRKAVTTAVENAFKAYRYHPRAQLEAMVSQDWSGRTVGLWHAHPPHVKDGGWEASDDPSDEDKEVAAAEGQNLTFVFQPDGFDAYDLSAGMRKISYRSEAWHSHFRGLGPKTYGIEQPDAR